MNFDLSLYYLNIAQNITKLTNLDWFHQQYLNQPHLLSLNEKTQNSTQNFSAQIKIEHNEQNYQPKIANSQNLIDMLSAFQQHSIPNLHLNDPNNKNSSKNDRNLNSIVIRNFTIFINSHPQLAKITQTIIERKGINITPDEYKKLFQNFFPQGKPYVGVGKLIKFLKSGHEVRLITMILLRKFINTDFFTVMINSKKVAKSAKLKQLIHGKKLWLKVLQKIQ